MPGPILSHAAEESCQGTPIRRLVASLAAVGGLSRQPIATIR